MRTRIRVTNSSDQTRSVTAFVQDDARAIAMTGGRHVKEKWQVRFSEELAEDLEDTEPRFVGGLIVRVLTAKPSTRYTKAALAVRPIG